MIIVTKVCIGDSTMKKTMKRNINKFVPALCFTAIILLQTLFIAPYFTASAYSSAINDLTTASEENVISKKYFVYTVGFSDSQDYKESFYDCLERTLCSSLQSVKEYFYEVSSGKYVVDAKIESDKALVIGQSINYYLPKYHRISDNVYVDVNGDGYDNRYFDEENKPCSPEKTGAKRHIDRLMRERALIKTISENIKGFSSDADENEDGIIDGISFIVKTDAEEIGWDDILWSHRSALSVYDEETIRSEYYIPDDYTLSPIDFLPVKIDGKIIEGYTVFASNELEKTKLSSGEDTFFSPSIICHEYMHDLGVADYYSYSDEGGLYSGDSVGEFDIMGGTGVLPQMPLSYTRLRLGFIDETNILPAETSGTYALFPTTSDCRVKAIKLVLNDYFYTGEYFMIEARRNGGFVDGTLTDSGIIIYRINEKNAYLKADGSLGDKNLGNMYGGNEVYVIRQNDGALKNPSANISYALLTGKNKKQGVFGTDRFFDDSTVGNPEKSADKTVIDQKTKMITTAVTYGNGENSGIVISDVSENADGSYTFNLSFDESVTGAFTAKAERYYDRAHIDIGFTGTKRTGDVTVYFAKTEGILKYRNETYLLKKKVTKTDLESGNVYGNNVIMKKSVPACYGRALCPDVTETVAVFVTYGDDVLFAGVLNPEKPTFAQYLFGTTKWLVMIIILAVAFVSSVAAVIAVAVVKEKRRLKTQTEDVDLSSVYGENYWMQDEEETDDDKDDDKDADKDVSENNENKNDDSVDNA